jgi:hypothetical protein
MCNAQNFFYKEFFEFFHLFWTSKTLIVGLHSQKPIEKGDDPYPKKTPLRPWKSMTFSSYCWFLYGGCGSPMGYGFFLLFEKHNCIFALIFVI